MSWTLISVTSRRKADRKVDRNNGNFLTSKSCFTLDCNLLNIGYTNNEKNTFIHIHSCLILVYYLTSHLDGTLFFHYVFRHDLLPGKPFILLIVQTQIHSGETFYFTDCRNLDPYQGNLLSYWLCEPISLPGNPVKKQYHDGGGSIPLGFADDVTVFAPAASDLCWRGEPLATQIQNSWMLRGVVPGAICYSDIASDGRP